MWKYLDSICPCSTNIKGCHFLGGRSEDFAAGGGGGEEMRAFQGEGREITVVPIKGDHWNSTELNRGSGKL